MSVPKNDLPRRGSVPRRRAVRIIAATAAVGIASTAIVAAGGGTAGAAALPQAQSVGNFLDATLGGNTLDAIAKLDYARAVAPGSNGVQNPLDVTLFNALNLPLTGALQFPSLLGVNLGAVTQKARANLDGSSYGQAGAALDSGGVQITDRDSNDKAGNAGAGGAALGGVKAEIGGVSANASTPKGYGKKGNTAYQIANIDLTAGSPALSGLLNPVLTALTGALQQIALAGGGAIATLTGCDLTSGDLPTKLSLEGGAIVIDPANLNQTIKISLDKLLKQLGLDLNNLPANTDLIDYLLAYLADPNGLAKGLQSLFDGLLGTPEDPTSLEGKFNKCIKALPSPLNTVFQQLFDALTNGQKTFEKTISDLVKTLAAAGGPNPLKPLADVLTKLIDIGVNVQPNGPKGTYTDPLAATPKQGTPVVKDQTIVRAIEVNVAAGAGSSAGSGSLPSLDDLGIKPPGSPSSFVDLGPLAAPIHQLAPGSTGILTLALSNAAAGPSNAPAVAPPSSAPPTNVPSTNVPTGVPAGAAANEGDSPVLPLVVLLLVLTLAGGGYLSYRLRGKHLP